MNPDDALERVFADEHGALVGALVRRFGDVDLAEDSVGEAYAEAAARWAQEGAPPNPAGWLATTAKRKALDRLRRESSRLGREKEALDMQTRAQASVVPIGVVDDDRLRLMFMCCHPALALDARVALTLRLVAGLTTEEIAAAFLVNDRALAQRITRAKRKIKDASIPFTIPARHDLPARIGALLTVLHVIHAEGYLAHSADHGVRDDLATEALRLTRQLALLLPLESEVRGLLALMLLNQARRPARVRDGSLVALADQDRATWDRAALVEGLGLVGDLIDHDTAAGERPGRYALEAAIAAAHCAAPTTEDVDWPAVVQLYDALEAVASSPVVRLNRAWARSHVEGPEPALAEVETLAAELPEGYHPLHVVRADLLRRLDRTEAAAGALETALALVTNPLERAHLEGQWEALRS